MGRWMRSYYYAIFGAMGGLFGWRVTESLVGLSDNIYITNIWLGGVIGFFIGFFIGASEDLLRWSLSRIIRNGFTGAMLGLIAGAIGLPLAEFVFQLSGGEVLGRALGWAIFGSVIGLSEGVVGGTQMIKGWFGGAIGGAIGGAFLGWVGTSADGLIVGKIIGLMLLGACVGIFIALIVLLLSRAWLQVRGGKMKGTSFELDKFMSAKSAPIQIGSDPTSFIYIADKDVEPEHAVLWGKETHFVLENRSASGTYIGSSLIDEHILTNGDIIRIGTMELAYYEKR